MECNHLGVGQSLKLDLAKAQSSWIYPEVSKTSLAVMVAGHLDCENNFVLD